MASATSSGPQIINEHLSCIQRHLMGVIKVTVRTDDYDFPCYLTKANLLVSMSHMTEIELAARSAGRPVKRRKRCSRKP